MYVTLLLLAGLLFSWRVVPHRFQEMLWNLLHGGLGHLHGHTLWQIPLYVFQVHLCSGSSHTRELYAAVVRPHFVLDPVFLEDVDRFQKCQPLNVLWRLKYFAQSDSQLFGSQDGEELIAVQDCFVMALHQQRHLLVQRVRLLCDNHR